MKQIDYLKLVATGRKAIHYAHPTDADDALTGFIGICFVLSLALIFGIGILASLLGATIESDMISWPIVATVIQGLGYFACSFFIGGAPRLIRYCIFGIGALTAIVLTFLALTGSLQGWYLFIPPFMFALAASLGAIRQL